MNKCSIALGGRGRGIEFYVDQDRGPAGQFYTQQVGHNWSTVGQWNLEEALDLLPQVQAAAVPGLVAFIPWL